MRRMAGGAVIIRHRRMQKSTAFGFSPMTAIAQLTSRSDQQRITVAAVRPMAEGAVAGRHRRMDNLAGLQWVGMTETAEAARIGGQQVGIVAGMGVMARRAASFDHRMHRISALQPRAMALKAEGIFLRSQLSMAF